MRSGDCAGICGYSGGNDHVDSIGGDHEFPTGDHGRNGNGNGQDVCSIGDDRAGRA